MNEFFYSFMFKIDKIVNNVNILCNESEIKVKEEVNLI